jgi:hypothetical protein
LRDGGAASPSSTSTPSPPPELQRLTQHFAEVDKEVLVEGAALHTDNSKNCTIALEDSVLSSRSRAQRGGLTDDLDSSADLDDSLRKRDPELARAYDEYAAQWGDAPPLSELAGHLPGRIDLFLE